MDDSTVAALFRFPSKENTRMQRETSAEYRAYALLCVDLATASSDRDKRVALREMAAEWLRLADTVSNTHADEDVSRRA